jgi:mono/diheme cytochrome c family protein
MVVRVLRWIGIGIGGLLGLIVIALLAMFAMSEWQMRQQYAIPDEDVTLAIPDDAASIARGRHLVADVLACVECHGPNLAGKVFIDDPLLGRASAANLTRGRGGLGGQLSDADFVRAIRHGVKPDGTSMFVMPVDDYVNLSSADLAAVVAYVKSVPPVDNELPPNEFRPVGRVLQALGQINVLSARKVDHAAPFPDAVPPGATVAYGHYLARTAGCTGCHGANLSGGPIAGAPPDWPNPPNLTPAGELAGWSDADIIRAVQDGQTPTGRMISTVMPWKYYHNMSGEEIAALVAYLRSVPPAPYGQR